MEPLKVLILEDVETDAELIAHRLRKSGLPFEARRVETRSDFEREVSQWRPDLVLADYCSHAFGGRAALQSVREHDPDLPFIFVSGESLEGAALEAAREGATDYISQDSSARLAPSVRRAIEQVDERRQRRQFEEELHQSEKRYRDLIDLLPEIVVVHRDSLVLFVNRQAALTLDAPPDSFVGKPVLDYIEPSYRAYARGRLQMLAEGHETGPAELKLLRADGSSVQVEAISRQIEYQSAPAVLTVIRDITKRKQLEKELLEVSAREQRRIGQDLHDILGQNLTGAAFLGKALEKKLEKQLPDMAGDAQKIVRLVSHAIAQARALSRGLAATEALTEGLPAALRELAGNTRTFFGIACITEIDGAPQCDEPTISHLYHIALEAVNNAAKHSGATRIGIKFASDRDRLTLSVTDNGRGFDPDVPREHQGMGLRIMKYRAKAIGAVLDIDSRPGSGVTVSCVLTLS